MAGPVGVDEPKFDHLWVVLDAPDMMVLSDRVDRFAASMDG